MKLEEGGSQVGCMASQLWCCFLEHALAAAV